MSFDSDLDKLLDEALREQVIRRKPRKPEIDPAVEYVRRLAEKALYRRLINESNIAQDGIRFIFWFGGPGRGDLSLDKWRRLIDKEIDRARHRNSINAVAPISTNHSSESESQAESPPTQPGG